MADGGERVNEEKKRFSPPAVGGSSLLVIFAVLCLTVFALLSMSTVQADRRLSDASAQAVRDYYEADAQAEEILARLRRGEVPDGVTVTELALSSGEGDGWPAAQYVCPISDTQVLRVQVVFPHGLGDEYKILRWQAVFADEWVPDDQINVWDGNS